MQNVYLLKENLKRIFSYKYFDVFTESSTVYIDQMTYKTIYSQQHSKVS